MFYIEPTSGLCNRLRVIQSAYNLSQITGQPLKVIWNQSDGMNIKMKTLFSLVSGVKVKSFKYPLFKFKLLYRFNRKKYMWFYRYMSHKKGLMMIEQDKIVEIKKSHNESCLIDILQSNKDVYIKTCSELTNIESFNIIYPSDKVLSKKEEVEKNCHFDKNMIGIHIRRTDNALSIKYSPTYLFEQSIRQLLQEKPLSKFYLATDSKEEEAELISKFRDNIYVFENKDLSRSTIQGQIDAYVELLILSECSEIWGSYWSSYSEVAAKIGNIRLKRMISNE